MKKQTAVEWLIKSLSDRMYIHCPEFGHTIIDKIVDEAKAMEKEQIFQAYIDVADDDTNRRLLTIAAEQYYNETYGGDK
jgi:hypothetical protein